jgi:hypothetical protein
MSAGDGLFVKGEGTAGTPDVNEVVTVQGIGAGGAQKVIGTGVTGATAAGTAMAVVPTHADLISIATPPPNVQATLTFAAVAGRTYQIAYVDAAIINNGGLGSTYGTIVIRNGLTGVGPILWKQYIYGTAVPAGLDRDQWNPPISGTVGNAMTIEFTAGMANYIESINAGVYYY